MASSSPLRSKIVPRSAASGRTRSHCSAPATRSDSPPALCRRATRYSTDPSTARSTTSSSRRRSDDEPMPRGAFRRTTRGSGARTLRLTDRRTPLWRRVGLATCSRIVTSRRRRAAVAPPRFGDDALVPVRLCLRAAVEPAVRSAERDRGPLPPVERADERSLDGDADRRIGRAAVRVPSVARRTLGAVRRTGRAGGVRRLTASPS